MQQYQQPYGQQPYGQQADPMAYAAALDARVRALEMRLPNTSLVSPSFMKRAFAVWGHQFVASMIIGIIAGAVGTVLSLLFAGGIASMIGNGGF